jgi:hypothetical protein
MPTRMARAEAGESYVVFGRSTGFAAAFELRSLFPESGGDGKQGFVLKGTDATSLSGTSVRGAGDVNGDGIGDVIIGAPRSESNGHTNAGKAYLVFGRRSRLSALLRADQSVRSERRRRQCGRCAERSWQFRWLRLLGQRCSDVNGDGIDDLIHRRLRCQSPTDNSTPARAMSCSGRKAGFPAELELSSLFPTAGGDGSTGVVLKGVDSRDSSGSSVTQRGRLERRRQSTT